MEKLGTVELETERLILRKCLEEDVEQLFHNWGSDSKMNEYLSFKVHESIEDTLKMVDYWIKDYDNLGYHWIIELKSSHKIIGVISGSSNTFKHNYVEVGYSIGSKYWEYGYATESLKEIINFFLNDCNLGIVEVQIPSKNYGSIKVAERCNMNKEATLKNRFINKTNQEINDIYIYSVSKNN